MTLTPIPAKQPNPITLRKTRTGVPLLYSPKEHALRIGLRDIYTRSHLSLCSVDNNYLEQMLARITGAEFLDVSEADRRKFYTNAYNHLLASLVGANYDFEVPSKVHLEGRIAVITLVNLLMPLVGKSVLDSQILPAPLPKREQHLPDLPIVSKPTVRRAGAVKLADLPELEGFLGRRSKL